MGQTPLFEREEVLANLDGDLELLQLLAATFIADAPRLVDEMNRAIRTGDAEAAARACHNTKGSVANFGAGELVTELKEMERVCRAGALDEAAATLRQIDMAIQRLVAELRELAPTPPG